MSKPTVTIEVTEKELHVLMQAVAYNSPYPALRAKLVNAELAMRVVRRIKNRANKAERLAKSLPDSTEPEAK